MHERRWLCVARYRAPMPKPAAERFASAVAAMPGTVYTPFDLASHPGPLYPLHVGDTWLEPVAGARMEDLSEAEHPGMHRYVQTGGIAPLVDAVVQKLRERNRLAVERGEVLVTAGATSGLACAVSALCEPGEEVLICAPFWPLIRGIVRAQRATPVEVPFFDRVTTAGEALAALEAKRTARTVALYFSNPSNPSGRVLAPSLVEALAAWARRHDLWILSDEVYEEFVYRGEHVSTARFAPERTLSAFSFSKTYGMAGNRVGYLAGPAALVAEAHKVSVHSAYHAPTAAQLAALRALEGGAEWVKAARESYAAVGREAAALLGLPEPEGSCFLFADAAARLDERGFPGFLADCFADGVVVAPGSSAGEAYGSWVRLCYTVLPPQDALAGVRRLARRLGRG
jgi:N-succinyldiaminopimelate aminotransferase